MTQSNHKDRLSEILKNKWCRRLQVLRWLLIYSSRQMFLMFQGLLQRCNRISTKSKALKMSTASWKTRSQGKTCSTCSQTKFLLRSSVVFFSPRATSMRSTWRLAQLIKELRRLSKTTTSVSLLAVYRRISTFWTLSWIRRQISIS